MNPYTGMEVSLKPNSQKIRISRLAEIDDIPRLLPIKQAMQKAPKSGQVITPSGENSALEFYQQRFCPENPTLPPIRCTKTDYSLENDASLIVQEVQSSLKEEKELERYYQEFRSENRQNQLAALLYQEECESSSESDYNDLFTESNISELKPFSSLRLRTCQLIDIKEEKFDDSVLVANEEIKSNAVRVISRIIDSGGSAVFEKILLRDLEELYLKGRVE